MTIAEGPRSRGSKASCRASSDGRSVIECRFVWKVGDDMTPNWPVEDGYVIEIEGDPSVRCRLEPIGRALRRRRDDRHACRQRDPARVAAPPGIVNHGELPLVTGHLP